MFYVREAFPKFSCDIPCKEKADRMGFENLSDGELITLATNLSEDKVKHVLEKLTLSEFTSLSYEELTDLITRTKARQLSAAFEIIRRASKKGVGILPAISCPSDTLPYLAKIKDEEKEHFFCLYLILLFDFCESLNSL